jgi:hypothetical protein
LVDLVNKKYKDEDNGSGSFDDEQLTHKGPLLNNLINDGILSIDFDKLNEQYCNTPFSDLTTAKLENLQSDFKIILKLIESLKMQINTNKNN